MTPRNNGRVLVIDDERGIRLLCSNVLTRIGLAVDTVGDGEAGLARAATEDFDLILCDINLPKLDGLAVLERLLKRDPKTTVILITAYPSVETAVKGMKLGARDYLTKPFGPDELRLVARRALSENRLRVENRELRTKLGGQLIGRSAPMRLLYDTIAKVAASEATILVSGESGTGKELVARAIHYQGLRAREPFVAINCGELVANLLESQLFGHEKGSFTGADHDKPGLFLAADGGTLFFDEVGELPLELQPKLLRALQEREVNPIGGIEPINVDTRVVAATNSDLSKAVAEGTFREDLYYRLNVISIEVPPLRDREGDVALLATHFAHRLAERSRLAPMAITSAGLEWLSAQRWPGNVRQLKNAIERALVLSTNPELDVEDFSREVAEIPLPATASPTDLRSLEEVEKAHVFRVLAACSGGKTRAAAILGINRTTLWKKLRSYGVA